MVIIISREGQLANRIVHASSFIVNAKEHKYKVVHLFFDDYYPVFSESLNGKKELINFWCKKKTGFVVFFQQSVTSIVKGFLKLRIKKLPGFEIIEYGGYDQGAPIFDLNSDRFIKKAKSKLVLVHGWFFRDPANQKKHKALLLEIWKPNSNYSINIENYFMRYKRDHDLVIGVHLRGGDYKKFEGGKWFYTPAQYYDKMKQLAELNVFRNKRLAFVICTNEKNISLPATDNFSVFNDERHFVEDLYLLSKCDYIIGPPSTFSMWASFYGGVPLYMLKNINLTLDDNNFRPEIMGLLN